MLDFERLRARAKEKRMPLTELAAAIGKNKYYIYDVQSKGVNISEENIQILADILETTPAYLKGETPNAEVVQDAAEFVDIYRLINTRPSTRLLFSTLKNASEKDIQQAIEILNALKKVNGE